MKTTEKKLLSNEEIASFCSQAAMLFQAGIPPVEGMAILQSEDRERAGKTAPACGLYLERVFYEQKEAEL